MRRSKRVAKQHVEADDDDATAPQEAARAATSKGGNTVPMEADDDVAGSDSSGDDEQPSNEDTPEENSNAEQASEDELELDAFDEGARAAVDALQEAVAEPAAFLRPSAEISALARQAAKALYGIAMAVAKSDGALPELYTENLDAEQIWLQLDMQLSGALKRARRLMRRAGDVERLINPEIEDALKDLLEGGSGQDASDSDADEEEQVEEDRGLPDAEDGDMREEDEEAAEEEGFTGKDLKPTEDRFLRLHDMERFVQAAERAELDDDEDEDMSEDEEGDEGRGSQAKRARGQQQDVDSEDEAALDALLNEARRQSGSRGEKRVKFQDEDDEADEDDSGEAEDIHYKDFFDPAEGIPESQDLPEASDDDADDRDDEDVNEDEEGLGVNAPEQQEGFLGEASVPLSAAQEARALSAHERRLQRMADRARKLEEQNVGEKEWFMRGEAGSGARPLNSALEVDLDFERAVRPPPQPTEEVTASIEDLIKACIAEHNFDDVPRAAPPAPERRRKTIELNDQKSTRGLGEIYEEEFTQATAAATGTALDNKEEKVRAEARALTRELFAKLDALAHFQYAPKPVVEDLAVRVDVPALAMEEVAPQIVSEAAMRLPEEVYRADGKGALKGEEELTHEERRRRRAQHKRAFKARSQQQTAEKAARAVTQGGEAALTGRKSMASDVAAAEAAKAQKRAQKKARRDGSLVDAGSTRQKRSKYSSSSAFFGQLQDQREAGAKGALDKPRAAAGPSSKALKL